MIEKKRKRRWTILVWCTTCGKPFFRSRWSTRLTCMGCTFGDRLKQKPPTKKRKGSE